MYFLNESLPLLSVFPERYIVLLRAGGDRRVVPRSSGSTTGKSLCVPYSTSVSCLVQLQMRSGVLSSIADCLKHGFKLISYLENNLIIKEHTRRTRTHRRESDQTNESYLQRRASDQRVQWRARIIAKRIEESRASFVYGMEKAWRASFVCNRESKPRSRANGKIVLSPGSTKLCNRDRASFNCCRGGPSFLCEACLLEKWLVQLP